jgi:hypothetical protein
MSKMFYVTLEYVCEYNHENDYKHEVPKGFNKFDTAQQFGETLMDLYKDKLTRVVNFTVCWR